MGMQNFDDTIHTFKWSSMSSFPVCMAVALYYKKIKSGYIIGVRKKGQVKHFPICTNICNFLCPY